MANVYEGWKGAVEPAEASPSGNEYQGWKGAVEPGEPGTTYEATPGVLTFAGQIGDRAGLNGGTIIPAIRNNTGDMSLGWALPSWLFILRVAQRMRSSEKINRRGFFKL